MEDHLHLLIQIPPVLTLSKTVATLKANSSRWASEEGHKFAWQQGYALKTSQGISAIEKAVLIVANAANI